MTEKSSGDDARWLTDSEQASWRAVLRGTRLLERALDEALHESGLQLSEYEILSMLSESASHRLRMSELAAMVVQSRSRLTHTAKRLEQRTWVVREPCADDGRGVELVLTPGGPGGDRGALAGARPQCPRAHRRRDDARAVRRSR